MSRRILRGFSAPEFRRLREQAGMSRGDLARVADISPSAVYGWETGSASPQIDVLAKAAGALDVSIASLVLIPPGSALLSDLRVLVGLTQPQLAERVGLSTTRLSNIERGEARLRDEVRERLAIELTVSEATVLQAYERARSRPPGTTP